MEQVKGRILCIDNDKDTCEMMTVILGLDGYEVQHALSVAEGLQRVQQDSFDLILLDWHFDDGTGIELCRAIRTFNTKTPILFYTGEIYSDKIERAMQAEAQGYLIKPTGLEEVLQVVSRYADIQQRSNQQEQ
jgi:CheY-like chemotaxis protein